ncbi:hypothetical protein CHC07_04313 [Variovorax sp. B4]|nr:hypothetical protein CHC06_05071 [Variovorax sp. B2]PNG54483.1 hypothetical protein CHC07_04313 [Variovorax sp. B4]
MAVPVCTVGASTTRPTLAIVPPATVSAPPARIWLMSLVPLPTSMFIAPPARILPGAELCSTAVEPVTV